jgi:hypothetical protein
MLKSVMAVTAAMMIHTGWIILIKERSNERIYAKSSGHHEARANKR